MKQPIERAALIASARYGAPLATAGPLSKAERSERRHGCGASRSLVAGLAVINATGVYAQLVAAHVAAKIDVQAHTVADLDRRLNQVDLAIEEAAKRGKTNTALSAKLDDLDPAVEQI